MPNGKRIFAGPLPAGWHGVPACLACLAAWRAGQAGIPGLWVTPKRPRNNLSRLVLGRSGEALVKIFHIIQIVD